MGFGYTRLVLLALSLVLGSTSSVQALTFNISYDTSVTSQSASFVTTFTNAFSYDVHQFEITYSDPISVNMRVGYGEVGDHSMGSGGLGASLQWLSLPYTYGQIKSALASD